MRSSHFIRLKTAFHHHPRIMHFFIESESGGWGGEKNEKFLHIFTTWKCSFCYFSPFIKSCFYCGLLLKTLACWWWWEEGKINQKGELMNIVVCDFFVSFTVHQAKALSSSSLLLFFVHCEVYFIASSLAGWLAG